MEWTSVVEKGTNWNVSTGTEWPFSLAACYCVTSLVMAHLALKNPQERGQLRYGLWSEGQSVLWTAASHLQLLGQVSSSTDGLCCLSCLSSHVRCILNCIVAI